MIKILISILINVNLFCLTFAQDNGRWQCEDNCGSGTLQEYWNGEVDCVCSLDCAGYGDACCNFYDECFENPSNLEFSDFIGTWNGNITNDETWSYDDPISIDIGLNGGYTVTNNPGGHLVSNSYPGTEEVYYGTNGYGVSLESNTKSETAAIYGQYANLLLAPTEVTGGFIISSPGSSGKVAGTAKDEEIYVLSARRSNMKDRVNKKNWTIFLTGSNAVSVGGNSSEDPSDSKW